MAEENKAELGDLDAEDLEIVRTVLSLDPEMEATIQALKMRRGHDEQCPYPIKDSSSLFDAFDGENVSLGRHMINLQTIHRYVDPTLFPLENDKDLARAVYLALAACNVDLAWAQQAPPHARELLEEMETQMRDMDLPLRDNDGANNA